MKYINLLIILSFFSTLSFADMTEAELEEQREKERILREFGNKQEYEEKIKTEKLRAERQKKLEYYTKISNTHKEVGQPYKQSELDGLTHNEKRELINRRHQDLGIAHSVLRDPEAFLNSGTNTDKRVENVVRADTPPASEPEVVPTNEAPSDSVLNIPGAENLPKDQLAKIQAMAKQMGDEMGGADEQIDMNLLTNMMPPQMKEAAQKIMNKNPFSAMPKEELRATLRDKAQGTKMGKIIVSKPKLFNALVEIAHDENAIPSFLRIMNKPKDMKKYGIIVLCCMICAFIINLLNSKANLLKRIMLKLAIMLTTTTINLVAFYIIFKENLDPAINAIKRTL